MFHLTRPTSAVVFRCERTELEMATLVAGVQYGLSSHSNFHENKSLIFVKLTDSAYRAIEDYLRNRVSDKK